MNKKSEPKESVTPAQAVRDIVVASMGNGQLPMVALFSLLGLVLYRLPPDKLSVLVDKVLHHLAKGEGWAYFIFLFTLSIGGTYIDLIRSQFKSSISKLEADNERLRLQLPAKTPERGQKR